MKNVFYLLVLLVLGLAIAAGQLQGTTMQTEGDAAENTAQATFAGGCFWCMEKPFEKLDGVVSVISGYAGGTSVNPTYNNYLQGGHREVVQVVYDPEKISYQELLDVYWRQVDPTDGGGQFVDRGHAYSTAIYYHDNEQKKLAEASKKSIDGSGVFMKKLVTPILPIDQFYKAEEYHQDYYKKNPIRYTFYRSRSGRDTFLQSVDWSKFDSMAKGSKISLRDRLTDLQYHVTQENGTEPPFRNDYWDNKKPGIYVDIVSGEPLFASTHKYKSGTGWPSFTKPLVEANIVEKEDRSLFSVRTEVRSRKADSHLGHVFDDGPAPTGLRYCINSAALRFVPASDLEKEGLGQYSNLFQR